MTRLRLLLITALFACAVPAVFVAPSNAVVRQDDPCEAEDPPESCEEPATPGDLIYDYYDETAGPSILSLAEKTFDADLTGSTINLGPIGPFPVQTRVRLRLVGKGPNGSFSVAKGKLNLAANATGTLKMPLTKLALKKLGKSGKLKVKGFLDLVNDTYAEDSAWEDDDRYLLTGLKK